MASGLLVNASRVECDMVQNSLWQAQTRFQFSHQQ
jgi:hypothetical protein